MGAKTVTVRMLQDTLLAWKRADYNTHSASHNTATPGRTFRDHLLAATKWLHTKEGASFAKRRKIISTGGGAQVQLKTITAQLRAAEHKLAEINEDNIRVDQVREYIFGLSKTQPKSPAWLHDRRKFSYHHGIPTLFLSDIHYGEVVHPHEVFGCNEFNSRICVERVRRVIDATIHLTHGILRRPQFPGIVLALGGDNINGALRDEALASNDKPIFRQAIDVADLLHSSIQKLLKVYKRVRVIGVPGNHGRGTMKPWAGFYAETNLDWLVYQMLERFFANEVKSGAITFLTPPARDVTYAVAGRRFRLTHGDQFRGGDSIIGPLGPVTRGDNKKRTMALTLPTVAEEYDTLLVGHFHRLYHHDNLIMNGSIIGFNAYSLQNNFSFEYPKQSLFLTHEKYGINHMMPVLAVEPVMKIGKTREF